MCKAKGLARERESPKGRKKGPEKGRKPISRPGEELFSRTDGAAFGLRDREHFCVFVYSRSLKAQRVVFVVKKIAAGKG